MENTTGQADSKPGVVMRFAAQYFNGPGDMVHVSKAKQHDLHSGNFRTA